MKNEAKSFLKEMEEKKSLKEEEMLGILKHYKTWTNEHGQLCICRVGSFGGTTLANFFQELSKLLESKYTEKELSKLSEVAINQIIENPL